MPLRPAAQIDDPSGGIGGGAWAQERSPAIEALLHRCFPSSNAAAMAGCAEPDAEFEAEAWLRRLGGDEDTLDLFLAWRSAPDRAAAFDRLAADRFDVWVAEHALALAWFARTPEDEEEVRNRLLDHALALETLILSTRSAEPMAIRAKAALLASLLAEQDPAQAAAMADIRAFVDAVAPLPPP